MTDGTTRLLAGLFAVSVPLATARAATDATIQPPAAPAPTSTPAIAAPGGGPDETITVTGIAPYASTAQFHAGTAQLGPLGPTPILTAPVSVTVLTQDFLANQQLRALNDALRALPSVEVREQQGLEVSRPQSWASRAGSPRTPGSTASTSSAPPRSRSRTSTASRC